MATRRRSAGLVALGLTALVAAGCKFDPHFPEDLYARCVDGRCPAPCTCVAGICLAPGSAPDPALCQGEIDYCGDGRIEPAIGEQCDDGSWCEDGATACGSERDCAGIAGGTCGPRDGDGCSAACRYEPVGGRCGNGQLDPLEACDDGLQCADWMPCESDADCTGLPPTPPFDQHCLPRNNDGCNPTCNFIGQAEIFLIVAGNPTLAVDNTWLWMAGEGSGEIVRVDIAACIEHLRTHPCQAGPPASCPQPCPVETFASGLLNPSSPASDGHTLWFFEADYQIASYLRSLNIASCEAALASGGDCASLVEPLAGSQQWAHLDGIGDAAALGDNRGLTYLDGMLYLVDGGCGTLRQVNPSTGQVVTLVGPASPNCPGPGAQEGIGSQARLASPRYMASDGDSALFVSDNAEHAIYRYDLGTRRLARFVGTGVPGYQDALDGLNDAWFDRPRDLASDGTSLYVADYDNLVVRQVQLDSGRVTTLAGLADACGQTPATGQTARLGKLFTLAYHYASGSLFAFSGQDDQCASPTASLIWRVQ